MPPLPPSFVVLDTETTGLDPLCDRVIDLGAVRLGPHLEIVERFQTLVDPGVPVPLYISRMVGLTQTDLDGAPSFADAYESFRAFVGDAVLVGHNVAFDREHLAAGARRAGLPALANDWLDTLEAALLLYPELDRHALPLLAAEFGIAGQAHRALPDAETAAAVLARLAGRAAGLAAEERRLLEAASWAPLRLLAGVRRRAGRGAAAARRRRAARRRPGRPAQSAAGVRRRLAPPSSAPATMGRAASRAWRAVCPGFACGPVRSSWPPRPPRSFGGGGVGLFEAGTGMGKSLAYLLPAAFYSAAQGRRVVVSTKTKALQRQLAAHELPLVAEALPPGWRWALLMGRENYVCRRRLDEAVAAEGQGLPDADRSLALAYLVGRARRGEVDLSALPYRATRELPALADLARELRSSRATCLGRHCPARRRCHWRLARARAEAAHLVCVNHALLLTGRETLPPFEDVVIDEAHLLYHEATEAFSRRVDARSLDLLLADLRGHRRQRPLARAPAGRRAGRRDGRGARPRRGGRRLRARRRHAARPRARRGRHARGSRRGRPSPRRARSGRTRSGAPAAGHPAARVPTTTAPSGSRRAFASSRRGTRSPPPRPCWARASPPSPRPPPAPRTPCRTSTASTPPRRRSPTTPSAAADLLAELPESRATPRPWCGARSRPRGAPAARPRSSPSAGPSPAPRSRRRRTCGSRSGTACAARCSPAPRSRSGTRSRTTAT